VAAGDAGALPVLRCLATYLIVSCSNAGAYVVRGFAGAICLRRTLYLVPHLVPLALGWQPIPPSWASPAGVLVGATIGAVMVACEHRRYRLLLSPQTAALLPPVGAGALAVETYSYLGSAVCQEIYYRGYLVSELSAALGAWAVPVTAAAFTLQHFLNRWSAHLFDVVDYARQAALSLALGATFLATGWLGGCIAAHVVCNVPSVVHLYLRRDGSKGPCRGGSRG